MDHRMPFPDFASISKAGAGKHLQHNDPIRTKKMVTVKVDYDQKVVNDQESFMKYQVLSGSFQLCKATY